MAGPRLVITPGDPQGIGPEVTAKALAAGPARQVVVVGHPRCLEVLRQHGVHVPFHPCDGASEPAEVQALRVAVALCLEGRADALVTGPIHKGRLAAQGFAHPGHTTFLGELCGVERPVMAFVGGAVRVALATVHVPLREVSEHLSVDGVAHTVRTAHRALVEQLGLDEPRLLVCGVNPHAGDGGLLGHEEEQVVAPAVARCRAEGIDAVGPVSAETAFGRALAGEADLVVATYHDQGLAPLKALGALTGDKAVNWTLGLPIVRTSVDHGTADDIVGTGRASESSMKAALALAADLAQRLGNSTGS